MKNIYNEALESIQGFGTRYSIDFKNRNLKFNGKYIIKDAKYDGELGIEKCSSVEDFLTNLENLYDKYKYSVPSAMSQGKRRLYFKALPEDKLSDDDMFYGAGRDLMQFELEYYVLCQIVMGFVWNESLMGKWFWQSSQDKDLVLLKDWF